MAKPQIEPGWLVSLMTRWAKKDLKKETGSMGYPTKSPGFSEKTTGGYSHNNPMAFSCEDFTDLENALDVLKETSIPQHTTMLMYYKPWIVKAMRDEGWAFGNSTYFQRLHAAHAFVARSLDHMKIVNFVHTEIGDESLNVE